MPRQARHSAKQLLWRGIIATASNALMITGIYPIVPHVGMLLVRRRVHRSSPPGQMRTMAAEWATSVALSAVRPMGFLGLPVSVRPSVGPRPIITVHGYAMNRACFLPLARRLSKAGLGPSYGFEYWTLGSVAGAARRLGDYVEHVCRETGHQQVDLIGHSMGGVVGRYYVTLRDGGPRVANLITIGSPHQGTDVSAIGIGRPHKELFLGSSLTKRLQMAPIPKSTHLTVIWSRSDALVSGARNARIMGVDEIIYDDLGHVAMLASPRVARAVADILKR